MTETAPVKDTRSLTHKTIVVRLPNAFAERVRKAHESLGMNRSQLIRYSLEKVMVEKGTDDLYDRIQDVVNGEEEPA